MQSTKWGGGASGTLRNPAGGELIVDRGSFVGPFRARFQIIRERSHGPAKQEALSPWSVREACRRDKAAVLLTELPLSCRRPRHCFVSSSLQEGAHSHLHGVPSFPSRRTCSKGRHFAPGGIHLLTATTLSSCSAPRKDSTSAPVSSHGKRARLWLQALQLSSRRLFNRRAEEAVPARWQSVTPCDAVGTPPPHDHPCCLICGCFCACTTCLAFP